MELYDRFGFRAAGRAPPLLPGQRRGRRRHVAHAGDAARHARRRARTPRPRDDPRAGDLLRRHLRGRGDRGGRGAGRTSSPPRASTTASAAWCRRSPRATTSSWSTRWSTTRWRAAGATLDDVDAVAVTQGPGLVGALLVGVATAKALAAARRLPLAPVDHLQGHVAANFLAPDADGAAVPVPDRLGRPHAARAGRRTTAATRSLGRTLDDAAGEAFDKGARLLGLGYPGGPALSRLAAAGDPARLRLPDRRARAGAGLLLRRAQDGAALQGARARGGGGARGAPPTSPRATSTPSSRR